jgi:hypothetical protein
MDVSSAPYKDRVTWDEGGAPGEEAVKKCCFSAHGTASLRINIVEAVLEDIRQGYPDNAQAGATMIAVPNMNVSMKKW